VWVFGIAELLSYDFQTISHFADVHLMNWLWKKHSRSVRRSESVLNYGMLEQRRVILSIILSFVDVNVDDAFNV